MRLAIYEGYIKPYLSSFLLLALLYVPIFGFLGTLPIRQWDESRLAVNAIEMLKNGDFIVTHYEGKPDMWNTKPPLMIWLQVASLKIFGINEFAIRFPSALAAFFTCIALLIFSKRQLQNYWIGFIAVLVLVTSYGYINLHGTRTGDYDALVALFTTLSCLSFFNFCESNSPKHLYYFFGFTTLAILTKSITGLLFAPAIAIYAISQKKFLSLFRTKHFYVAAAMMIITVGSYYLAREYKNPGYLLAVQQNELGGRYLNVLENNTQGFWFYYDNLVQLQFKEWILFIPCGIAIGLVSRNKLINKLTLFLTLLSTTFLLIISTSQTKLEWYDIPLYPILAMIVALGFNYIFNLVSNSSLIQSTLKFNVVPFLLVFLVFIIPYQKILNKTYKPKDYSSKAKFYEMGYYLQSALRGKRNIDQHAIVYNGYNAQLLFYVMALNEKGVRISFKDWQNLQSFDKIILSQSDVEQYIKENYYYDVLQTEKNVQTLLINGRK